MTIVNGLKTNIAIDFDNFSITITNSGTGAPPIQQSGFGDGQIGGTKIKHYTIFY